MRFQLTIIILVGVIILVLLISKKKKESYPNLKPPKIAILIICAKSSRWNLERQVWRQYADKFPSIRCFFIECDMIENLQTLTLRCKENYIPGIYQKSLQALKKVGDDFDFYLRGNLSTFYIFEYLNNFLLGIPRNIPVYTGGKISWRYKPSYTQGTSIILNKLARNKLIHFGFEKRYYYRINVPDDVLISQVLFDHNVGVFRYPNHGNLYVWDYKQSYNYNLMRIQTQKNPFLRLKTSNLPEYKNITQKLLVEFYSP